MPHLPANDKSVIVKALHNYAKATAIPKFLGHAPLPRDKFRDAC